MLLPALIAALLIGLAPTALPAPAPARTTVAVLAFRNATGRADYDHLGGGLAAMMTTDLAAVEELQLVERERLADVNREIEAQQSTAFDATTAVRTGRLVGAQYIVTGDIAASAPQLRLDTRVIRVETGEVVKTASVTGREDKFFELQQKLARQLVRDLDIALSPDAEAKLAARQEQNRLDEVQAVVGLSNALSQFDAKDYGGATVTLAPVVARYPNSLLVRLTAEELRRRTAAKAAEKAKEKARDGINGLLKKRWP